MSDTDTVDTRHTPGQNFEIDEQRLNFIQLEHQLRQYRRARRRRRNQQVRSASRQLSEAARLVLFAEQWAPYGGPPDDEIFLTFGMTPERFRCHLAAVAHGVDVMADEH